MNDVVKAVEQPVFLKKKHELADLQKSLERASPEAVDVLIAAVTAPEEKLSLKTKAEFAKVLIELQIKVADQINKDQLTRQIAEVKVNGPQPPSLTTDRAKKPSGPILDLNTIQEVV